MEYITSYKPNTVINNMPKARFEPKASEHVV